MSDIKDARPSTRSKIAEIIRGLRAGKSPKEIAVLTGETHRNIQILIHRYREVHDEFVLSYGKRYPNRTPTARMSSSLREV